MESCSALRSDWVRAALAAGLLGFFVAGAARDVRAEPSEKPAETGTVAHAVRDVHSRHFLLHTDVSPVEADAFIERLEAVLGHFSTYWGQPLRGVIECYAMRNLETFPLASMAPGGVQGVKTAGGIALMQVTQEGKRQMAKSVVYAAARLEVLQHETVHAYCHQTFRHIGPVWYSEGMAEVGHFWQEGDTVVRANPREIEFLRHNRPKSLAATLSPAQVTGDCWQNYAARWALCHFLTSNPNYAKQFRQFGRALLMGKDVTFEQTYAAANSQLFFEYLFFLEHIGRGYRVDLCAWDWTKKFTGLQPGRTLKVAVAAGRGWQPAGLTVHAGTPCEYLAAGVWQIAGQPKPVDANGDNQGRGRLVGVVMKDNQLGDEFELGANGSLPPEADGDLYLRCRNTWNALAHDTGHVAVEFQLQGQGPSLCEADN
jgi:hypothetical protein